LEGGTVTKLLSSPEIKRVLKAAKDAGVEIGPIDIYPDHVTIHPLGESGGKANAYDVWKQSHDRAARR
jgi:hypothetical protein